MATRFFSTAASLCGDNYLESAVWLTIWLVNAGYRPVAKENFSPIIWIYDLRIKPKKPTFSGFLGGITHTALPDVMRYNKID